MRIVSPSAGERLKVGVPRGSLVALATVTGTAEPYQSVRVAAARCHEHTCTVYVVSGRNGRWRAELRTLVPLRHSLVLGADYALPHGGVTATRVRVKLQPRALPKASSHATPGSATQAPVSPPVIPQTPSSGSGPTALTMIGDSLAVGMRPYLSSFLPGWRIGVNGRVGRPLAEGMGVLSSTALPSDGSTVLAMSLFTNDDPTHTSQLERAVRTALSRVGSHGCLLWGTINRPPVGGVSYAAANDLLERMRRTTRASMSSRWLRP